MMFRKVAGLVLAFAMVVAGALPSSAESTVKKLGLVQASGMGMNTADQSSLVVLPNETIISFHNNENEAALLASVLSADGKTAETNEIFASGNSDGQNPSRFDWVVSSSGKLTVVYTTWLQEAGKVFAGMSARNTTDGANWSAPVTVLPTYQVDSACEPITGEICGYIQPHLKQSANGKLLLVAAKTNLVNSGWSTSTASLVSSTSVDGSSWSTASMGIELPEMSSNGKQAYYSKGLFAVEATQTDFVVLYPYLIKSSNIFKPSDTGYKSASLPLSNLAKWQTPKVVTLVPGLSWAKDGGNLHMGPFLVKTSNKLLALWFEKPADGDKTFLRESIWNPTKNAWDARKDIFNCKDCWIYNTAATDRNAFVVSGATLTLPFVVATTTRQGSLRTVKFLTIVDGAVTNGAAGTTVATNSENLTGGASFYGLHLGSDNTLTLVLQHDLIAEVVEVAADRKTQKVKRIDTLWQNENFVQADKVVHSYQRPNGNLSLMSQQYRTSGNPSGTVLNYYQLIRATPPVLSGTLTVSGTAKVTSTLKTSSVTFSSPFGASNPSYKWYRCDKIVKTAPKIKPTFCVAIPNAIFTSYKLTSKDKGKFLLASAESSNSGGSTLAFSTSTGAAK
jgi:hypothetical protein